MTPVLYWRQVPAEAGNFESGQGLPKGKRQRSNTDQ